MVKGVYKTKTEESGAEYAAVDYDGRGPITDSIPRHLYEDRGYEPPFDELPTKEAYDAAMLANRLKELPPRDAG